MAARIPLHPPLFQRNKATPPSVSASTQCAESIRSTVSAWKTRRIRRFLSPYQRSRFKAPLNDHPRRKGSRSVADKDVTSFPAGPSIKSTGHTVLIRFVSFGVIFLAVAGRWFLEDRKTSVEPREQVNRSRRWLLIRRTRRALSTGFRVPRARSAASTGGTWRPVALPPL